MEKGDRVGAEMTLLAEFNHRLFNTLQIILAAIAQCRRDLADRADLTSLTELESRLIALGRMHRLLARPAPVSGLEDHCRSLCLLLMQAFGREDITLCVAMDEPQLSPEQAYSLPLLVVELVTNVLKHSLTDQIDGIVWIRLQSRGREIEVSVSDNRRAPLPVFSPSWIVSTLARTLHGEAFVRDGLGRIAGARVPSEAAVAHGRPEISSCCAAI